MHGIYDCKRYISDIVQIYTDFILDDDDENEILAPDHDSSYSDIDFL